MKIRKEVKTYNVHMLCDECREGHMKFTGMVLESMPPWYVHKCDACSYQKNFREHYPSTEYEEILQ